MRRSAAVALPMAGTRVFGAASVILGIARLGLHDQLVSEWQLPGTAAFLVVTSIAEIAGGAAMQSRRTEAAGALLSGAIYLLFASTYVPDVVAQPGVYYTWGDVFYPLAIVAGAVVALYRASPDVAHASAACRGAIVLLGLCCASFAAEQLEFFKRTAGLVPAWMPLGGTFWTIATTAAFVLAALALVSGYKALLAAQLTTVMFASFVLTVWIPALLADSKSSSDWSEGLETFVIAGAFWIVSDFLRANALRE